MTRGKLLSAEQSVRLAIVDSVERDKLIEHIVRQMRAAAIQTPGVNKGAPVSTLWRRMET